MLLLMRATIDPFAGWQPNITSASLITQHVPSMCWGGMELKINRWLDLGKRLWMRGTDGRKTER